MAITVRCWCGCEYQVHLSDANSFGRCPKPECRAWVRIPPEALLRQFDGRVVEAAALEASMPDRRKLEFDRKPPAKQAMPLAVEPARPAAAQSAAEEGDLPVLEVEEAELPARQPAPGDDALPFLELEEP